MKTMLTFLFALAAAAQWPQDASATAQKETPATEIDWRSPLEDHAFEAGQDLLFACPPRGEESPGDVWGTDVYTADSAICPAAIHAGRITAEAGGTVTVRVVAGRNVYAGSPRNGVLSLDYDDAWERSFLFVDRPGAAHEEGVRRLSWTATAEHLAAQQGEKLTFLCPPGGEPAELWGTDVYTADSSICTAAVHAGKIAFAEGGEVTLTAGPGQPSYPGSERRGVRSESFGAWQASFTFD